MRIRVAEVKEFNGIGCGNCGRTITDPNCTALVYQRDFMSFGVTCPYCDYHHHMDLTERMRELGVIRPKKKP